ncbi:MAG: type 4a pilus biogenesis protein PilO [Proteobacteria bacterium]|nr:type 4a pilus biogenesis protein PilO [Pseudomonadota bacterium]
MKKSKIPWDKLDKLKTPHKLGILAGTIILLGVGFYFLLYQPTQTEGAQIQANIEKLEGQIQQHERKAREIPKLKERLEEVQLRFSFASRLLPETKEVDQLLKSISDNGAQSGLNVVMFQPQPKDALKDFYAEITFDMRVEGPYLNVATFFYRLGQLPRIVNISDIKMGNPKMVEGDMILTTDCRGTTFRFMTSKEIEEVEKKKAEAAKPVKRRRPPKE